MPSSSVRPAAAAFMSRKARGKRPTVDRGSYRDEDEDEERTLLNDHDREDVEERRETHTRTPSSVSVTNIS